VERLHRVPVFQRTRASNLQGPTERKTVCEQCRLLHTILKLCGIDFERVAPTTLDSQACLSPWTPMPLADPDSNSNVPSTLLPNLFRFVSFHLLFE